MLNLIFTQKVQTVYYEQILEAVFHFCPKNSQYPSATRTMIGWLSLTRPLIGGLLSTVVTLWQSGGFHLPGQLILVYTRRGGLFFLTSCLMYTNNVWILHSSRIQDIVKTHTEKTNCSNCNLHILYIPLLWMELSHYSNLFQYWLKSYALYVNECTDSTAAPWAVFPLSVPYTCLTNKNNGNELRFLNYNLYEINY